MKGKEKKGGERENEDKEDKEKKLILFKTKQKQTVRLLLVVLSLGSHRVGSRHFDRKPHRPLRTKLGRLLETRGQHRLRWWSSKLGLRIRHQGSLPPILLLMSSSTQSTSSFHSFVSLQSSSFQTAMNG